MAGSHARGLLCAEKSPPEWGVVTSVCKQVIPVKNYGCKSNTVGESILTSIGAKHQSPGIIHLFNVAYHLCVSEAIFYKHLGSLTVIRATKFMIHEWLFA